MLEEKRIKLSEQKKELDELLPLKSELESTKNEAEKFEKEAKDVFDTAWNGVVVNSKNLFSNLLFSRTTSKKTG